MKYIDEFRNSKVIKALSEKIKQIAPSGEMNIMEVCGTHTQSFCRFGLDKLLPPNLRLIAGPGCPICVSEQIYIDKAIALARMKDAIILSFGDMLRVPGSESTLEKQRAEGSDIRVLYSCWDSLKIARNNPAKKVIFLAVGFETTAPAVALTIEKAKKENLKNLFFLSSLKLIPPVMERLLQDKNTKINGFLCPGHVSTIIGWQAYEFIPQRYSIGCCVAGFEPLDILEGIYLLLRQIVYNKPKVENQYQRVVKKNGNPKAKQIIQRIFKITDANWRGLGRVPQSGLRLREQFLQFDAEGITPLNIKDETLNIKQKGCRCGDVLKGLISPSQCPLFAKKCSPDNPIGPCMVSSEGACNAYYRYH